MDHSSSQHHQEMSSQTLESMLACTKAQQDKKPRPPEQALKCPRCDSANTKFCYYNNYSLTQPRYFCKSCRRYWTKGGTLRNVPVGGGCRKNKRPSSSSSSKRTQDQPLITANPTPTHTPLSTFSPLSYDSTDLSLAFARLQNQTSGHLGFDGQLDMSIMGNLSNTHYDVNTHNGFLDALRNGFVENPNGFHTNASYYGNHVGNGDMSLGVNEGGSLGLNVSEEMGIRPYEDHVSSNGPTTAAVAVTTVKQEAENNRVLWGYPWQLGIGGGEGNNQGDVDFGRQSWINGPSSSWHGLLNTPLM